MKETFKLTKRTLVVLLGGIAIGIVFPIILIKKLIRGGNQK